MKRATCVLIVMLTAAPVVAQQGPVCVSPANGQIDVQATETLQAMIARSDSDLMSRMAGTWYTQSTNSYTGQVDYQYQRYSADGFFDYQDRVCDAAGGCNDYAGQGSYAVIALGDGTVQMMSVVSDTGSRDRVCTGSLLSIVDADTIQFSTGAILRRVPR